MAYISKHFKKSFEVYKRNFVPIILSILLIGIIYGLFFGLGIFALFGPKGVSTIAESYMMSGEFTDFESQEFSELLNLQNVGLFLLFIILGGIIAIFLQAGFWGVCFYGIKKRVTMKTFFTIIRKRGISYFLATLLVLIIISVILIFLILPTVIFPPFILVSLLILILIIPFFILISPAVISGEGVIESLEQSFKLGKKYYFDLILLIILIFLFSLVSFIPIIGSLLIYFFISPLFTLTICSFYIDVKQKPEKIKQKRTIKKQKGKRK